MSKLRSNSTIQISSKSSGKSMTVAVCEEDSMDIFCLLCDTVEILPHVLCIFIGYDFAQSVQLVPQFSDFAALVLECLQGVVCARLTCKL